jgi:undecaprenyl-diphosphatase
MLHEIQAIDTQLFLVLNGWQAPWADALMYWATQRNTWIPLYVLLIGWLGWQYQKRAVGMVATLLLTILLADQATSAILKPLVARLRPCYVTYLQGKVHLVVESCGGQYGFASSHAANSFGLALALWLMVGKRFGWVGWFFFPWAVLVSYSRIYVGVHYPLDVVAGALVGSGAAWAAVWLKTKIAMKQKLHRYF